MSTTKANYVVASEASKEVGWLSRLACDMGMPQLLLTLFYDSKSVMNIYTNCYKYIICHSHHAIEKKFEPMTVTIYI